MSHSHRNTASAATMFVVVSLFAREAWSAPTAADAALKAIQALDTAAAYEEEKMSERCVDLQTSADAEAAAAFLRAAYIHMTRMERAKEMGEPAEDLTLVAIQAANDFKRAYLCDRSNVAHLASARILLTSMLSSLPSSATHAREEIEKGLAVVVALEASSDLNVKPPMPRAPRARVVTMDAGEVTFNTPLQDSYLGRLSLRADFGFGTADLDGERKTRSNHRGFYFRTQLLARFKPGEQKSVILLFGPYYNFLRSSQPALGDANLHGFGAHFELQWGPPRVAPWLSLHPFVDLGIEHIELPTNVANISGFQIGGGAMLCVWHASFCPNVRLMTVPLSQDTDRPTIQVGMALDVFRLVDLSLSRRR